MKVKTLSGFKNVVKVELNSVLAYAGAREYACTLENEKVIYVERKGLELEKRAKAAGIFAGWRSGAHIAI